MRISEIKTFTVGTTWRNWVFVSVETDEGLSGMSGAKLEGKEKTVETAIHELKRRHKRTSTGRHDSSLKKGIKP